MPVNLAKTCGDELTSPGAATVIRIGVHHRVPAATTASPYDNWSNPTTTISFRTSGAARGVKIEFCNGTGAAVLVD